MDVRWNDQRLRFEQINSTGVRSRFRGFEDISVGTEKINFCFVQALELVTVTVSINLILL